MINRHAISWFEIPTSDLARAQTFYETILGIQMTAMDFPNLQMRVFPVQDPNDPHSVSGALTHSPEFYLPQANGTLVYLNGNPDVQVILDKVEAAGGTIVVPKTHISDDIGDMAIILDTEGNRVAFHNVPARMAE